MPVGVLVKFPFDTWMTRFFMNAGFCYFTFPHCSLLRVTLMPDRWLLAVHLRLEPSDYMSLLQANLAAFKIAGQFRGI